MFARFAGAIPVLSVAALAILTFFNLGYFWTIGLHFLGLVDINNFVYSIGLALTSLFFIGQLLYTMVTVQFKKPLTETRTKKIKQRANLYYLVGGGLVVLGFFVQKIPWISEFFGDFLAFFGFVLGGVGVVFNVWLSSESDGSPTTEHMMLSGMVLIGLFFTAGMLACQLELDDTKIYKITTSAETIEGARILRSSSTGFIIVKDKVVRFIPQTQVRDITSLTKLR